MKWFYNLKIATKLIVAFGAVQVLTLILGVSNLASMGRVNQASTDLAENWMPSVQAVMTLRTDVGDLRRWELAHMLNDEDGSKATYEKRMDDTLALIKKDRTVYEKLISSPEEQEIYNEFGKRWDAFLGDHTKMIELSRLHKVEEARQIATASATAITQVNDTLGRLVKLNKDGGDQASAQSTATFQSARIVSIVLLVVNIAGGMLLALWVARVVAGPLRDAVSLARDVADGDLTRHIEVTSSCETGQLQQALKDMTANLQRLVSQVRVGTDTIATASNEIASGNQDLSSRTEQQASSLEETASSMEELTSTVKQNADNARQANQLAASASAVAVRGGDVVGQVVGTMASINDSSHKIVDIIAVIDGIAFQTNILALNAAVEAARAGEQGRGFAVVAGEVRNLAHRSSAAAKDIKALINDSVEKVENGSRLVGEAGTTMEEIVTSINRVTDIMSEITSASVEQSHGIEQVNVAITQMDQVTQQNAALVEEAAAAAEAMQEQAARLSEVVAVFKLHDMPATAPQRRPAVAAPKAKPAAAPARPAPVLAAAPRPTLKPAGTKQTVDGDEWETF